MWNAYDDRELLDWQWQYERLLRRSSIHSEYMSQDLKAINQILHKRGL
jgi:hypothetical protein